MELLSLRGIGPKSLEKLNQVGIETVEELLNFFPVRFQMYPLGIEDGKGTLEGVVVTKPLVRFIRKGLNSITFKLSVEGTIYDCIVFNRAFLKEHLRINRTVYVTGTVKGRKMTVIELTFLYEAIKPVYKQIDIPPKTLRGYINQAMHYKSMMKETLDERLKSKYKLVDKETLFKLGHHPETSEDVKQFLRRQKYEEFLYYQIEVKMNRKLRLEDGVQIKIDLDHLKSELNKLPFTLTKGQKYALRDILEDLSKPYAMNRLIQGDVGSGKTIIAMQLMSSFHKEGYQSAFMAPTELLAKQHYEVFQRYFPDVPATLLTSSFKNQEELLKLEDGSCSVVIGTHALFQANVNYHNLALVITDEQHRFGVNQRNELRDKGLKPHVLSLSATPIPRTLAITLFGDMELSTIKEKPIGRKEIRSKVVPFSKLNSLIPYLEEELDQGHQVYFVTALIEESDMIQATTIEECAEWCNKHLSARVEVMHGKLKPKEKDDIMNRFRNKEVDVLISTTVIEVGVDVPNATSMVILDSDRFGLSQLHQLRGRIGRGTAQSTCFFLYRNDSDLAMQRLRALEQTTDGFALAELDLKLRGPGDFLGSRQSGFPTFQFAHVFDDFKILQVASEDATELVYNRNDSAFPLVGKFIRTNWEMNK